MALPQEGLRQEHLHLVLVHLQVALRLLRAYFVRQFLEGRGRVELFL